MDNRCSSPNIELNMRPHQVCEVVSAGHVLEDKDLESLAVGVALKSAKVILLEAHGGTCGAIKLALMEKEAGVMEHALTEKIAHGLGKYSGVDSPEIFAATLENLNEQMAKILNPTMELKLLREGTGKGSFYELFREGRCLVLGAYVDFEVLEAKGTTALTLIKRLTFFESLEAISDFVDAKISAYLSWKHLK